MSSGSSKGNDTNAQQSENPLSLPSSESEVQLSEEETSDSALLGSSTVDPPMLEDNSATKSTARRRDREEYESGQDSPRKSIRIDTVSQGSTSDSAEGTGRWMERDQGITMSFLGMEKAVVSHDQNSKVGKSEAFTHWLSS